MARGGSGLPVPTARKDVALPKPNYQFEKRRRELDKKKKDEEKKQRKLERARAEAAGEVVAPESAEDADAPTDEPK